MKDKDIISLYFDRDERAIEYTAAKYGPYCRAIAEKLLSSAEDREECLNDVWLAAWESIPPNDPPSLSRYLGRIARNVSVRRLRYINRKKRGRELTVYIEELGEAVPDGSDIELTLESEELSRRIGDFLKKQKKLNRQLFICRYYYLDSVGQIAERFSLTENQVKLRLFRMRGQLKKYLEKEGVV